MQSRGWLATVVAVASAAVVLIVKEMKFEQVRARHLADGGHWNSISKQTDTLASSTSKAARRHRAGPGGSRPLGALFVVIGRPKRRIV